MMYFSIYLPKAWTTNQIRVIVNCRNPKKNWLGIAFQKNQQGYPCIRVRERP